MKTHMTSKIKIDKGIPIPAQSGKTGDADALRLMDVGDSFLIKGSRPSVIAAAKRIGIKVVTRAEGKGFRLWRTQ